MPQARVCGAPIIECASLIRFAPIVVLAVSAFRLAVALSGFVNSRTLLCAGRPKRGSRRVGRTEKAPCAGYARRAAQAGHLQVIQIIDKRQRDKRRNGYKIILKDAEGVTEQIVASQGIKDQENQRSTDTNVSPDRNAPDLADSGATVPLNSGARSALNSGATVPLNLKEDNPLRINPLALRI